MKKIMMAMTLAFLISPMAMAAQTGQKQRLSEYSSASLRCLESGSLPGINVSLNQDKTRKPTARDAK